MEFLLSVAKGGPAQAPAAPEGFRDAGPDAVVDLDADGVVLAFDHTAEQLLHIRAEDALGRPFADLVVPPEARANSRTELRELLLGRSSRLLDHAIELRASRGDGSLFPAELRVTRTSDVPRRFRAWLRDRTREEDAVAGLEARQALLDRAERVVGMGSWELCPATGRRAWTDNLFRIFGLEPRETPPSEQWVLEQTHPDDRDRVARAVATLRREGRHGPIETRTLQPGRPMRHLISTVVGVVAGRGRPEVLWGMVEDVTDQRQADRRIAAHVAVSEALAEWGAFDDSAELLLRKLAEALGFGVGILWVPFDEVLAARAVWHAPSIDASEFESLTSKLHLPLGADLPGRAWEARHPIGRVGVLGDPDFGRRQAAALAGLRDGLAVPALAADDVLAVVELYSREDAEMTDRLMRSLTGIGHELGQFLHHRRGELQPSPLTGRELEVLQLAAHGNSGPQIAKQLVVSQSTVKTHFEHIYAKLGAADRAAAVAKALRLGLIT
jgi:PAS domain S-box-containing protein